jgi:hypothetical protein
VPDALLDSPIAPAASVSVESATDTPKPWEAAVFDAFT